MCNLIIILIYDNNFDINNNNNIGGAISLMDMNPDSVFFRKFASNPFAFAAFKSTEPWLSLLL